MLTPLPILSPFSCWSLCLECSCADHGMAGGFTWFRPGHTASLVNWPQIHCLLCSCRPFTLIFFLRNHSHHRCLQAFRVSPPTRIWAPGERGLGLFQPSAKLPVLGHCWTHSSQTSIFWMDTYIVDWHDSNKCIMFRFLLWINTLLIFNKARQSLKGRSCLGFVFYSLSLRLSNKSQNTDENLDCIFSPSKI